MVDDGRRRVIRGGSRALLGGGARAPAGGGEGRALAGCCCRRRGARLDDAKGAGQLAARGPPAPAFAAATRGSTSGCGCSVVDEGRVSIGDYVLSGGELPAMVVDRGRVSRQVPGVVKLAESVSQDSFPRGLLRPSPLHAARRLVGGAARAGGC